MNTGDVMRKSYYDNLRIIATIAVVVLHVAAYLLYKYNQLPLNEWMIGNIVDSLTRWCVPLFVMISGALLLKREEDIRGFLRKRVSKVVIPLFAWSVFYFSLNVSLSLTEVGIKQFFIQLLNGKVYYHLWFLYMIIGIYLLVPLIRKVIKQASIHLLHYALILWFIYMSLNWFLRYFTTIELAMSLPVYSEYVGYFILGYYLDTFQLSRKIRVGFYYSSVISIFIIIIGTYIETMINGRFVGAFYSYYCPLVTLCAIALFILFKNRETQTPRWLLKINSASLGIYLIHPAVMLLLDRVFLLNSTFIHPLIGIPVTSIMTIIISTLTILVIQKIPILKRMAP